MPEAQPQSTLQSEVRAYYEQGGEAGRLFSGMGQLELARTRELIARHIPPPPAVILDIGGGSGVYACRLARQGYEVHLTDPVPLHVEQACRASEEQPGHPLASATVGDARNMNRADGTVDAVLLFGPLYHLTDVKDRVCCLREARRVLRHGGLVLAVGISRFASALNGLVAGFLDDPEFVRIVRRDLAEGQHRNLTNKPGYFTTAFFHHPDELAAEIEEAGLRHEGTFAVEGPGWLLQDFDEQWSDLGKREWLLTAVRWLETEPSLLGASAHLLAVGRRVF